MTRARDFTYKNYSMNTTEQEKYFVHFDTKEMLSLFLRDTKMSIGYKCCEDKGAHLFGVTSYDEVNKLKSAFLNKIQKNKNINYSNRSGGQFTNDSYECPVCLDTYNTYYPMNCRHHICMDCIKNIKKNNNLNNRCPICRNSF